MFKKAMIASAVLAGAFAAQAQVGTPSPSGTLTVTGTIPAPVCTLTLGSNGTVAYGTLARSTVTGWAVASAAPARYYSPAASAKTVSLNVSCPAPTKMALSIADQRSTSMAGPASYAAIGFGLGTYTPAGGSAQNIGNYHLPMTLAALQVTPTVGGTAAAPAQRLSTAGVATPASTWAVYNTNYLPNAASLGFVTTAGNTTPDSLVSIAGTLPVNLELVKSVVDGAQSDITLDGNATITLVGL